MFKQKCQDELKFPLVIPGDVLDGKKYDWNDANGGAIQVSKLGFNSNNFMGGSCAIIGLIKELGFYGCLDKYDPKRLKFRAFYITDAEKVTEKGWEILSKLFPKKVVVAEKLQNAEAKPIDIPETVVVKVKKPVDPATELMRKATAKPRNKTAKVSA
jgi:hypothetical protein